MDIFYLPDGSCFIHFAASSLAGATTTYSYSSSAALPGNPAHLQLLLKYRELQVSTAHLLTVGSATGTSGSINYIFSNGRIESYTGVANLLHNPQKVSITYLN